jgi:hypothetical protein
MEIQADVPTRPAEGASLRMKLTGLRRWNGAMAALHFAQGAALLALASSFSLPVTNSFLRMDAVTDKLVAAPDELFRLRIGPQLSGDQGRVDNSAQAHVASSTRARPIRYLTTFTTDQDAAPAQWRGGGPAS